MARYIDADLIPYVESENGVLDDFAYRYDINEIPTADVIPKSEYDCLEKNFNELVQEARGYLNRTYRIRAEVAREIFEEIDKLSYRFMNDEHYIFGDMVWDIAELKKKYTEG